VKRWATTNYPVLLQGARANVEVFAGMDGGEVIRLGHGSSPGLAARGRVVLKNTMAKRRKENNY
jgi:hypothetical protein